MTQLNGRFCLVPLKHFGFKDDYFAWIQTLYKHPSPYSNNNGWKSQPILPQHGIRQGYPISLLLFIIAAEVMAPKNKILNFYSWNQNKIRR